MTGQQPAETDCYCHHLEQGGNKQSGRCSLLTLTLPPEEGKKEEKGESKLNIKGGEQNVTLFLK